MKNKKDNLPVKSPEQKELEKFSEQGMENWARECYAKATELGLGPYELNKIMWIDLKAMLEATNFIIARTKPE